MIKTHAYIFLTAAACMHGFVNQYYTLIVMYRYCVMYYFTSSNKYMTDAFFNYYTLKVKVYQLYSTMVVLTIIYCLYYFSTTHNIYT